LEFISERLLPVLGQLYRTTAHDHGADGTVWALQRTTRWRLSTSRPDRPLWRVACSIINPSTHSSVWLAGLACNCPASSEPMVTRLNSATSSPSSSRTKLR